MRIPQLALVSIALALPAIAQQPAPVPPAAQGSPLPASQEQLHASAMKFVEASDTRQRLEQNLDKLLEEGKQSMLRTNPLMDPKFADEWLKRMRAEVDPGEFVNATAQVYEKYFTSDELDELAQAQLATKKSQPYTLPPQLAQKLKTNSALIQHDINVETSIIGSRLGKHAGEEIAKEHPEWVTPASRPNAPAGKR